MDDSFRYQAITHYTTGDFRDTSDGSVLQKNPNHPRKKDNIEHQSIGFASSLTLSADEDRWVKKDICDFVT